MNYVAKVYWQKANGEPVTKAEEVLLSAVAAAVYVPLYNEVVDMVNPFYEIWNHLFEEAHPGLDGESKVYQDYIMDRANELIKGKNERHGVTVNYEILEKEDHICEVVGHFMDYRCFIRIKPQ